VDDGIHGLNVCKFAGLKVGRKESRLKVGRFEGLKVGRFEGLQVKKKTGVFMA
jgi:hypothetical protein